MLISVGYEGIYGKECEYRTRNIEYPPIAIGAKYNAEIQGTLN